MALLLLRMYCCCSWYAIFLLKFSLTQKMTRRIPKIHVTRDEENRIVVSFDLLARVMFFFFRRNKEIIAHSFIFVIY